MKKYLLISLVALVSMVFAGCEKNEPCRFHKVNVDFHVPENAWAYDSENEWFTYYFPTDKITESIYDYGTWTVSHEYNPGTKDAYLIQLPEFFFEEIPQTDTTSYYYTRRVDYEVGVGYVQVYVTNSDYIYDDWTPDEMYFHMQIVY